MPRPHHKNFKSNKNYKTHKTYAEDKAADKATA